MKWLASLAILCFLLVACGSGVSQSSITGGAVAIEAVEDNQEEAAEETAPTPSVPAGECDVYKTQLAELNKVKDDLNNYKADMIAKLNAHENADGAQKTTLEAAIDQLTKDMNQVKDTIKLLQKQVDALAVGCA